MTRPDHSWLCKKAEGCLTLDLQEANKRTIVWGSYDDSFPSDTWVFSNES